MLSVHLALVSAALLASGSPRGGELARGAPAPPLAVETWLDGAPPVELGAGRACVLVFWATWCGSCVAEFPRLNALAEELANEPLDFVSLADQPREEVEALLAARPLSPRVALDRGGATFDAYGVRVLPRVVLVDPRGRVAATPRLEDVDAAALRSLAAGEPLALEDARATPADLEWDRGRSALDGDASLAHVWIERSSAASGAIHFPPERGRITADGVGFGNLVQVAFGAESHEVRSTHPAYDDFETVYRVSVKAPDDRPETARAMLREQLERLFAFRAEWVEVEERTPVLRRIAGADLGSLRPSSAAKSSGMARNGSIHFVKVRFESIVQALGAYGIGRGFVDETGLAGEHDVDLDWTPGDVRGFAAALLECGLEWVEEPRAVRRLALSPR